MAQEEVTQQNQKQNPIHSEPLAEAVLRKAKENCGKLNLLQKNFNSLYNCNHLSMPSDTSESVDKTNFAGSANDIASKLAAEQDVVYRLLQEVKERDQKAYTAAMTRREPRAELNMALTAAGFRGEQAN